MSYDNVKCGKKISLICYGIACIAIKWYPSNVSCKVESYRINRVNVMNSVYML